MSAIGEKIETQVWYLRKDGTIGTYTGNWDGPVCVSREGIPYQRFNCGGGNFRTFRLCHIVKVKEDGKQVYPVPRKMARAGNGRFVKS
jgi:hypothetical protein